MLMIGLLLSTLFCCLACCWSAVFDVVFANPSNTRSGACSSEMYLTLPPLVCWPSGSFFTKSECPSAASCGGNRRAECRNGRPVQGAPRRPENSATTFTSTLVTRSSSQRSQRPRAGAPNKPVGVTVVRGWYGMVAPPKDKDAPVEASRAGDERRKEELLPCAMTML